MNKNRLFTLTLILCLLALTACSASNQGAETAPTEAPVESAQAAEVGPYVTAQDDGSGSIVIDTAGITETARYINYESGGSTIQLIAVRGSDGEVRVSLNTCQACTPSPKAYFVQDGSWFICQNCMNAFSADQIGLEHGGCNPMPIEEKTVADGSISIPTAYLDQFSRNFANWQGPTE